MLRNKPKRAVAVFFNLFGSESSLEVLAKFPGDFCVGQIAPAKLPVKSNQINCRVRQLPFPTPRISFRDGCDGNVIKIS